jgi:hypothetical protein
MTRPALHFFAFVLGMLSGPMSQAQTSGCLSDADIQSRRSSLVYVWSPRMVLSAQHAATVRKEAAKSGLSFVPVHDPRVPLAEVQAALQALSTAPESETRQSAEALGSTQPLCSPRLQQLEALRHFPSAFVIDGQGSLPPLPLVGAMPAAAWSKGLSLRLSLEARKTDEARCIAPNAFHALPASLVGVQSDAYGKTQVILGSYERVSPDGRFILRSFSGGRLGEVSLIELDAEGRPIAAHDTPLSNEAFPVQGSWRYIVNVNGDHYTLPALLNHRPDQPARPVFQGGMTGFYAAAAEIAGDADFLVHIRSMSWPNAQGKGDSQGEGALQVRTLSVDTRTHRIVGDSGNQFLCTHRARVDGTQYALPMISVDGEEFAAMPQMPSQNKPTMRIYGFGKDGKSCEPRTRFPFFSGKTIFGFSGPGQKADLAYEYRGQIWWFHRGPGMGEGQRFNLAPDESDPRIQWMANAFPGITRDGRIIYAATRRDCPESGQPCTETVGYITADPYQSHDYRNHLQAHPGTVGRRCITQADVRREREAFAQQRELISQPGP